MKKSMLLMVVLLLSMLLCSCSSYPETIDCNGVTYRLLKADVYAYKCDEQVGAMNEHTPLWRVETELFDIITPSYQSDILYVQDDDWQAARDYLTNPENFRSVCIVGNIFGDDVVERTYDLPSMDGNLYARLRHFDDENRRIPFIQLEHPDADFLAMNSCVDTLDYEISFRRLSNDGGFLLPVCTGYLPLDGRIVLVFVRDGGSERDTEGIEIVELEPALCKDILHVLNRDGIPYRDAPDSIFLTLE